MALQAVVSHYKEIKTYEGQKGKQRAKNRDKVKEVHTGQAPTLN